MSRRERRKIRRNTTVIAVALMVLSGIGLFYYSVNIGNTVESSSYILYGFSVLSYIVGAVTWGYETNKYKL